MYVKKLISFLILLIIASPAHAAIFSDATSSSGNYTTAVNLTTITVTSSQSNMILVASLWAEAGTAPTITSITAGGQTMLKAAQKQVSGGVSGDSQNYIYYLVSPPTGSINVTTTWSGGSTAASTLLASLYGVSQTNPIDSSSTNSGATSGNASTTITTNVSNVMLIDSGATRSTTTNEFAPGIGQTSTSIVYATNDIHGQSIKLMPTSGATSTYWIGVTGNGTSQFWSEVTVGLTPFTSTSSPTILPIGSGKLFMGSGKTIIL